MILPPGVRVPWQGPFGLAFHNVEEYSNLSALPQLIYPEQKGVTE